MPYGRRKKGGQRLMEMAKRRRLKAIKDKEGRLAPMVIKPTLSRLRTATPAQRRRISRPKGGQILMEMAKKRRKKADAPVPKKKSEMGPEFYRRKKPGVAPRKTRTTTSADKARMKNLMSEAKSMSELATGQAGDLSKAQRATWESIIGLATAPLAAVGGAYKAATAARAARAASVAAKAKRAAAAAKKAKEAKKGVSGIGATRAASARARTSGLGKAKAPKPKPKKKKKSAAQIKRESMRGGSAWR